MPVGGCSDIYMLISNTNAEAAKHVLVLIRRRCNLHKCDRNNVRLSTGEIFIIIFIISQWTGARCIYKKTLHIPIIRTHGFSLFLELWFFVCNLPSHAQTHTHTYTVPIKSNQNCSCGSIGGTQEVIHWIPHQPTDRTRASVYLDRVMWDYCLIDYGQRIFFPVNRKRTRAIHITHRYSNNNNSLMASTLHQYGGTGFFFLLCASPSKCNPYFTHFIILFMEKLANAFLHSANSLRFSEWAGLLTGFFWRQFAMTKIDQLIWTMEFEHRLYNVFHTHSSGLWNMN